MKPAFYSVILSLLYFYYCVDDVTTEAPLHDFKNSNNSSTTNGPPENSATNISAHETPREEDFRVLNESITKYGFPQNYQQINLPGPEIAVDGKRFIPKNDISVYGPANYTFRIRTVAQYFSYNGRYEIVDLKEINDTQIPVIRGQFGEHFKRKNGGFYIRTIGYTLDENGFSVSLIDLTRTETKRLPPPLIVGGTTAISSTVLITLTGGNSVG